MTRRLPLLANCLHWQLVKYARTPVGGGAGPGIAGLETIHYGADKRRFTYREKALPYSEEASSLPSYCRKLPWQSFKKRNTHFPFDFRPPYWAQVEAVPSQVPRGPPHPHPRQGSGRVSLSEVLSGYLRGRDPGCGSLAPSTL